MSADMVLAAVAALAGMLSLSSLSVMLSSARAPPRTPAPAYAPAAKTTPPAATQPPPRKAATGAPTAADKRPAAGDVYTARATYYGPDEAHGRNSGDDIFQFIPSSGYTPEQLRKTGGAYCAMTLKFLKMGWMGKIVRVTGSNGKVRDLVVVDTLPDRNDGKNVAMDIFTQKLFEELGGSMAEGMADIKFQLVGPSPVPVPDNSPYNPKKYGFA